MAVTLEALDFSRPVQVRFAQTTRTGTIHSVFSKALNIAVDDTLIVLLSAGLPRMPNGMHVPVHLMGQLYGKLSRGMEISVGDEQLFIPALNLTIQLPYKTAWEPVPAIQQNGWRWATLARHARMLARHLAYHAKEDGLGLLVKPLLLHQEVKETPLATIALPLLRLLVCATHDEDRAGIERAAHRLAGLGPGLTPSGDDTLGGFVGVLALLSFLSRTRYDCDWMESPDKSCRGGSGVDEGRGRLRRPLVQGVSSQEPETGDASVPSQPHPTPAPTAQGRHVHNSKMLATIIVDAARPRTGLLSGVLLTHAALGEVAEHVGELLVSLTLPVEASDAVLKAADRVLAYGACSGGDTLLGVLLGLQALGIDNPVIYTGEDHGYTGTTQAEYVL